MTDVKRIVYVMAHNGGCEGHSVPIQAFATIYEARCALALIGAAGLHGIEIFEVPMWPNANPEPYYRRPKAIDS